MLKRSILALALVAGLIAVAGVAVASMGSGNDVATSDVPADVLATVGAAADDDGTVDDDGSTTTTTMPGLDDDDSDDDGSTTTTMPGQDDDDANDDGSTTTTTMPGYDDDSDDDSDDEYDDDSDDDYDDDDYGDVIADGVYPVDASPAGSVTVEVRDGMLLLTSVDIDPVWMLHKREEKSDEVELGFYWGESELKIKVEIDDGQLKKMVEFDLK